MVDKDSAAQAVEDEDQMTPGARLKQIRESLEKNLTDVSEELHLDRWMLEAIERDDFASLGAPVFAKGHLRQYAKSLGIDPDDLMVGYYQVCGSREQPPLLADSMLRVESRTERDFSWVVPLLIALLVIGAIAGVIFWYLQPTEEPSSIGGDNRELSLEAQLTTEPELIPASIVQAAEPADVAMAESVSEEDNSLLIPAEQAPEIIQSEAVAQDDEARIVSNNITVTLRFTAQSWVEVYDSKRQKLLYGLVESASAKYLSGPPPISVFLGHQNAVKVEVNGSEFAIPPDALRGNTARFQIERPN